MPEVTKTEPDRDIIASVSARIRLALMARAFARYAGLWLILALGPIIILNWSGLVSARFIVWHWSACLMCVLLQVSLARCVPVIRGRPLVVGAPVRGRWQVFNSPATKIPSHGTNFLGQTYGLDLAFSPDGPNSPISESSGSSPRRPEDFPSFGAPVFAAANGTVVRAHNAERDHNSRSGRKALRFFKLEQFVRALGPPSRALGNHLIVRLSDGSHLVYAHLRRDSQRVAPGDEITKGDVIASCGNSGNTTRPHLHIQRQDVASMLTATGLPWAIEGVGEGGTPGFPKNGERFEFR
jgi:hypothetical protein